MKKITLLATVLFFGIEANAQLFSDNFDAYTAGYLGPQSTFWSTWSNTDGSTEDVQINTAQFQSGTQSVYFSSSSANGGPQDVLLKLGQVYSSGIFTFETSIMIPTGKNAHLNFQKTLTPGQAWTMNFTADNGNIVIDDAISSNLATGTYSQNQWFKFTVEANLTLGIWEAFIDDVSIGSWNNGTNQVASVDFFPANQNASFYIDDVSFDHETYTLPTLNAIASEVNMQGNIATQNVNPIGKVTNGGQTTITSLTAVLNYNGTNYTQNLSSLSIASLTNYTINFGTIPLVAGSNTATMTISNINGGSDENVSDDVTTVLVNPVVPAPGKMVVGEEGTGTWCQWCPRGAVFMDKFENDFGPFWAGIAVHNGDPMTVATYDTGMGTLIAGYPSALVDRGNDIDPSAMANDFYTRLQVAPTAFISMNQLWDASTRVLTVEVSANFQSAANNNYKFACVLTEDGVTGTGSGYNQSNAYAGGGNGVMGGYETLPSSVPAAQMVYDHVARAIQPSFAGDATSFPTVVNAGETHSKTYTFTLPASWDESNMHIVGMLLAPNGRIDNAAKAPLNEVVGINENAELKSSFTIYPNPATFQAVIALDLAKESQVEVALIDLSGKVVASKNYGTIQGSSTIDLNTSNLQSGVYLVQVKFDNNVSVQRLVIQ